MPSTLVTEADIAAFNPTPVRRFDPVLWQTNFDNSMHAALITTGGPPSNGLRLSAQFRWKRNLVGLIWYSKDLYDFPMIRYGYRTGSAPGSYAWDGAKNRDYSGLTLKFHLKLTGNLPTLDDAINGASLTVETWQLPEGGEAAHGTTTPLFLRLWNYATNVSADKLEADITLNFDTVEGGFYATAPLNPAATSYADAVAAAVSFSLPPPDAPQTVPSTTLDKIFFAFVDAGYVSGSTDPINGGVPDDVVIEITRIAVTQNGAHSQLDTLPIGYRAARAHTLRIAAGYDDSYNVAPERFIRNWQQLGYRGTVNLYAGFSKTYAVVWDAAGANPFLGDYSGGYTYDPATPLNGPTRDFFTDFLARCYADHRDVIISVSFELFFRDAPRAWLQQNRFGEYALTGWDPPSGLVSPCSADGIAYLLSVFLAFLALQPTGANRLAQIGEPWWWIQGRYWNTGFFLNTHGSLGAPTHVANAPCFYDFATKSAWIADPIANGNILPEMDTALMAPDAANPGDAFYPAATLVNDGAYPGLTWGGVWAWLQDRLGDAMVTIRDGIKASHPTVQMTFLIFPPQFLDSGLMEFVNVPKAQIAYPAFDFAQAEDYDWLADGPAYNNAPRWDLHSGFGGVKLTMPDGSQVTGVLGIFRDFLGYPISKIQFFGGFVAAFDPTYEDTTQFAARVREEWGNISLALDQAYGFGYGEKFVWADPQVRGQDKPFGFLWLGDIHLGNLLVTNGPTPPAGRTITGKSTLDVILLGDYSDGSGNMFPRKIFGQWDATNRWWKPKGSADGNRLYIAGANVGDVRPPETQFIERIRYDDASVEQQEFNRVVIATSPNEWVYGTEAPEDVTYLLGRVVGVSSIRTPEVFAQGNGGPWDCTDTDLRTGGTLNHFQVTLTATPTLILAVYRDQGGEGIPLEPGVGYSISGATVTILDGHRPTGTEKIRVVYV